MMVVIASISILSSFLIPALKHARDLTKEIHCVENMNQISAMSHGYAADNNLYLPKSTDVDEAIDNIASTWVAYLIPYSGEEAYDDLFYRFGENSVFACPVGLENWTGGASGLATNYNTTSGGWTEGYKANGKESRRLPRKLLMDGNTALLADSDTATGVGNWRPLCYATTSQSEAKWYWYGHPFVFAPWHGEDDSYNILFADGRVSPHTTLTVTNLSSPTDPNAEFNRDWILQD